jgi:F-type H+-transporting ATPase subunit b
VAAAAPVAVARKETMEFIYESEFWVAVSFFIFVGVLVYFGVHTKVVSALDARALLISKELEEARRLREEAEKVLADYRRKLGDVVMEADNIIATGTPGS